MTELPTDLIDIKAAARACYNMNQATIRRWILRGKLRGFKAGCRKVMVSRADLMAMIQPIQPIEPTEGKPREFETTAEIGRRKKENDRVLREHGIRK